MITLRRKNLTLLERIDQIHYQMLNEELQISMSSVFKQIETASKAIIKSLKNQELDLSVFLSPEGTDILIPQPVKVQEAIAFLLFFHFCVSEDTLGRYHDVFLALEQRYGNLTQPGSFEVRVLLQANTWEELLETLVALKEKEKLQDFTAASRNWKDSMTNFLKKLKLRGQKNPRYPQRKRGYTDKGTLADPQLKALQKAQQDTLSTMNTEEQNEIESQRDMTSELIQNFQEEIQNLRTEYQNLLQEIEVPVKRRRGKEILT